MLALLLNPEDTVATALSDAASGDTAEIILGREKPDARSQLWTRSRSDSRLR